MHSRPGAAARLARLRIDAGNNESPPTTFAAVPLRILVVDEDAKRDPVDALPGGRRASRGRARNVY